MITQAQAKSMIVGFKDRWGLRMEINDHLIALWQRELGKAGMDESNARKLFDSFVRGYQERWKPCLDDLLRYVRLQLPQNMPATDTIERSLTPDSDAGRMKRVIAKHFPQSLTTEERSRLKQKESGETENERDVPDDEIPF